MIANCGHDERKKYSGGQAGDQTGTEYGVIQWYNRPWTVVLRHPNAKIANDIAYVAAAAARNDMIGYDQNQRTSFWSELSKVPNYDPAKIATPCEADCSSSVATCVKAAGLRQGDSALASINPGNYTTSEIKSGFMSAGFQASTDSKYLTSDQYLLPGDVLLYEGHHAAINLDAGAMSGASSSGGSSGGSSSGSSSGGRSGFPTYPISDAQVTRIARQCDSEQGDSGESGIKMEASQMCNLFELKGGKCAWNSSKNPYYGQVFEASKLDEFVDKCGWYAGTHGRGLSTSRMDTRQVSQQVVNWVKDVVVNGNRTLPNYVDEHDAISDLKYVENPDGSSYSAGEIKNHKDWFISGKTKIRQGSGVGGSEWIFYAFCSDTNPYADPFGYYQSTYDKLKAAGGIILPGGASGGGSSSSSSTSSAKPAQDYKQFDSKWADHVISGTKSTMKSVGCGPTSIADIVATIPPPDVADFMGPRGYVSSSGSTYSGIINTFKNYNIGCVEITSSVGGEKGIAGQSDSQYLGQLLQHLKSGKTAVLLMGGTRKGGANNFWTKGGHYIAAMGANNSNVMIYDPGSSTRSGYHPLVGASEDSIIPDLRRIFLVDASPNLSASATNYSGGAVLANGSTANGFSEGGLLNNIINGVGGFFANGMQMAESFINSVSAFAEALSTIPAVISAIGSHFTGARFAATFEIAYQTVTAEIERDEIKTITDDMDRVRGANLMSYPSLVEAPYIILTVGDYKFGTYSKEKVDSSLNVNYPNYINSMTVEKVNGQVNQYTIGLVYQIQTGNDPNLLDRIFSSVGYGTVKISYGDWASPTFVYKEEEAIITDLASNIDFASSRINYTLKCTSNSLVLASGYFNFDYRASAKPSDVIREILNDPQYGLQDVFTGMTNSTKVDSLGLIASDDRSVEIEAKHGMDPISYINYLVTCMCSNTSDENNPLKDSAYFLTIQDDTFGQNELNGPYFKISKVDSEKGTLTAANTYEVDIGYPTDNLVTNFSVLNNNSWSLLYNYSDKADTSEYSYSIDNDGHLVTEYSPAVATSSKNFKMTETQRTWWTQMTQFPITAELSIKGLVRPIMLMTYLRVNALFFGQRHISSGLYVITKQTDTIDGSGYRTRLSLLRIAGDNDYIVKTKIKVTSNLPVAVNVKKASTTSSMPSWEEIEASSVPATQSASETVGSWFNSSATLQSIQQSLGFYSGGATSESNVNQSAEPFGSSSVSTTTFSSSESSGNFEQDCWNEFMKVIGNAYGVAGLMGNLNYETGGFKPSRLEGLCKKKYRELYGVEYTDESYTEAVDTGKIPRSGFIHPMSELGDNYYSERYKHKGRHYGYGLVQWTDDERKGRFYDTCRSKGVSIADGVTQCQLICYELQTSEKTAMSALKAATSVVDASDAALYKFERPDAEAAANSKQERRNLSQKYYDRFANSSSSASMSFGGTTGGQFSSSSQSGSGRSF